MKVLLFSHIHPSSRYPTRGTFSGNIFRALSGRCDVKLIAAEPWWARIRRPAEWRTVPQENFTGVEAAYPTYWSVPRIPALHGFGMYASVRSYAAQIRREFPFDIILAAWAYPDGVAAAQLAREFGCPLVTKILGSDINELPRHPLLRPQIQGGLGRSERVVTVSRALRDAVIALGIPPEKVIVQHNGVDGEKFALRGRREARAALGLPQERPLICYVGRLSREKGVDVLVNALGHLRRAGRTDVELVLVGSGAEETALRSLAAEQQVAGQIRFCGNQPHADIPHWISACDVFCLPSRREGCPNVVLEALASGRPVVATQVGGLPELIRSGNGILVPSEAPQAMAQGLQEALERPWDAAALRASVEFLSWDAVGAAYYQVLTDALEEWNARHPSRHEGTLPGMAQVTTPVEKSGREERRQPPA